VPASAPAAARRRASQSEVAEMGERKIGGCAETSAIIRARVTAPSAREAASSDSCSAM